VADKGYDGAGIGVLTPVKGNQLASSTATGNELLGCLRTQGERGNALLKTQWKALQKSGSARNESAPSSPQHSQLTTAERPIH